MYYKLLNKNLLTAALVSLITLSAAKTCDAQGVVSLVEDNNAVAPQKNTAQPLNGLCGAGRRFTAARHSW